jgi:hypothetical protein
MLRLLVEKIANEAHSVIRRPIHFVLAPSATVECTALDVMTALRTFTEEEKLPPMIYQMWMLSLQIAVSVASCPSPTSIRVIGIVFGALKAAWSFVNLRVMDVVQCFWDSSKEIRDHWRRIRCLNQIP